MRAEQACTNCGNRFTRLFCNECGQKVTHRISMAHLGHDILHAFTHTDKGFFFMMIQLFRRPGTVAREYIIEGKRKKYFMPFQYILIIGTIAAFVVVIQILYNKPRRRLAPMRNIPNGKWLLY